MTDVAEQYADRGVAPAFEAFRRARARLAAAALLIVALWEVVVLVSAQRSEPSHNDWEAVAAAIPAASGDQLIVFAPSWLDPVGRQWLGNRISLQQAARMDTARYRQVWEVSIRGASAPDVVGEPAVSEQYFGPLRLRRFVHDAPRVTWDTSEGARICEIDFQPRRGLVLDLHHRFDQARRVYRQVELGNQLQVYAGLADYKKRSGNRSQALVQAMVDGREVARRFVGNDDGWVALPPARTNSGIHDVEIVARVHDPHEPIDVSVCVAAEARAWQR